MTRTRRGETWERTLAANGFVGKLLASPLRSRGDKGQGLVLFALQSTLTLTLALVKGEAIRNRYRIMPIPFPFAAENSRRYDLANVSLAEIKTAIEHLSFEERAALAAWLHGWKDDEWDEQMKRDIASGKLDDVLREVEEDIKAGRVRELP